MAQMDGRHLNGISPEFRTPPTVAHVFLSVAKGLSTSFSYVQLDTGQPSWQYPHGTESQVWQGADRHCGGTSPEFSTAPTVAHAFLSVANGLSTPLSYEQVDGGQPSWQYPHGTNAHAAHGAGRH